ncbi:MAG: HD domain-containing protein, partial [Armatimonadota bacterium]|nr:HD domain-containing protein [Armatimonadota bacterium]
MRVKVAELPFESVDSWIEKQRAKLEDARDQVSLVSFVKKERESLARRAKPLEGVSLMRKYTGLMDLVIARLLDVAVLEAEKEAPPGSAGLQIAVAATGGYGRGELCPFSDIDVVFIAEDDESPGLDAVVRRMFHLIMDVFLSGVKLKVGYSYRQPDQLLGLLHETQTALLDARRLAGSEMLFQRFQSALRDSIDPLEFLRRNRAHREQARQRFGQSPHRVEPNIKEGAGGLRDIHTARWAAQVAFGVSGERAFEELHAQGALTDLELSQAVAALDFLSGLRNALHLSSGRGNDALTVERQEAVPAKISFPKDLSSADLLMRSYYTHAENVDYLLAKILDFCDEQRIVIEPGIVAKRGILYVEAAVEPKSITRIIGYAQHYRLALAQNAQDAIRHTLLLQPVEVDRESQRRFFNSLSDPQVSNTLTQIARIGALQWILPEFADLMHLLPGDAAHEHTVGEHSLQVARNLDALKRDEDEEIRGIFADIKDRRTLFLAGLLHDVGKTNSNGNHAELGAVTAEAAAKRIGMPDEDAAKVG